MTYKASWDPVSELASPKHPGAEEQVQQVLGICYILKKKKKKKGPLCTY